LNVLRDPDVGDRDRCDEWGKSLRHDRSCHRMIDASLGECVAHWFYEIAAEPEGLEPLNSSVFDFLRPQVQECRGVLNLARSMRSRPLSCDDSLPFEAGEYTVRQAGGHRRSFGKVHNGPAALRVKKEGLGDEACLASESSRRCWTSLLRRTIVPGFQMQEQTGEFDMHVPQSVDDTDPVVREQAPRLARSGLGDEHEGSVRAKMTGPRGELVSGRRVRVSLNSMTIE
jgi:hypothetical protein